MTSGHFIYIPMILLVGTVFGFILGGRAARDAIAAKAKADAEKKARKEARARGEQPDAGNQPEG